MQKKTKNARTNEEAAPNLFRMIVNQLKGILSLSDEVEADGLADMINKNLSYRGPIVYILIPAIIIASVGLNINSIPVIIGAMLISPLMGPIIALGYGLGINDTILLKRAAINLIVMVAISILASSLYFLVSPLELDNPSELLARTRPTIFDVIIALFGGFAAIIELVRREKGTVFSGVAIATALMPPLCTAGYGIANGEFSYFIGALYLFSINSVFIALATFITVKYLKLPVKIFADPARERRVHQSITLFIIVLIIPSVYSAISVIRENNFEHIAKSFVNTNKTMNKSYIYDYQINHKDNPPTISISIAGEVLSEEEVTRIYLSAENFGLLKKQVLIEQSAALVHESISDNEVVKSIFERNEEEIRKRENYISEIEEELKAIKSQELPYQSIAEEVTIQYPEISSIYIARGHEVVSQSKESSEKLLLVITTISTLNNEDIDKLERWLKIRLGHDNLEIIQDDE